MSEERKKKDEMADLEKTAEDQTDGPQESDGATAQESALVKLREQLELKDREAKDHYDRFLRQVAELENFKRRAARDRDEAIRFAKEDFVRDLLPIVDNLERAVMHAKGGGNGKPLVDGVELVLKGLLDVLSKHGVEQITAVGQPFDPGKHEAMAQVESEKHQPNTVVEEHNKGYTLQDRLLRPALVSVAKPPETKDKKNNDSEVENDPSDD
jgi:molecular chaperone GrpE